MIDVFKKNLANVHERMASAAAKSGRSASEIQLVAVTKYVDAVVTGVLVDAGWSILGENRPQQLWSKAAALSHLDIQWHMIGHLQRNKVKRTVEVSSLIHSVDSWRLLKAIDQAAADQEKLSDVLFEVNVSGESAKHGLKPSELPELLLQAKQLNSIRVRGLMCMAGLGSDESQTVSEFEMLRQLRESHQHMNGGNIELTELSMGMSGDFELAIEHGATIIRVGSAIFDGIR